MVLVPKSIRGILNHSARHLLLGATHVLSHRQLCLSVLCEVAVLLLLLLVLLVLLLQLELVHEHVVVLLGGQGLGQRDGQEGKGPLTGNSDGRV